MKANFPSVLCCGLILALFWVSVLLHICNSRQSESAAVHIVEERVLNGPLAKAVMVAYRYLAETGLPEKMLHPDHYRVGVQSDTRTVRVHFIPIRGNNPNLQGGQNEFGVEVVIMVDVARKKVLRVERRL